MSNSRHRLQFPAGQSWQAQAQQPGSPDRNDLWEVQQLLQSVHGRTELVFLNAGRDLVNLTMQFDRIEAPLLAFGDLVESGRTAALSDKLGVLEADMSDLSTALTSGVAWVKDLACAAHQLRSEVGDMARIVRTMTIVALNARVTVAALTGRHSGLEVFTKSASELVARAVDILRDIQEAVVEMVATTDTALGVGEILHRTLDQSMLSVLHGLEGDLRELHEVTQKMQREGRDLSALSQKMRASISTASAGLQIGDTTRQRLEHILAILAQSEADTDPSVPLALGQLAAVQLADCRAAHAQSLDQISRSLALAQTQSAGLLSRDNSLADAIQVCKREDGFLSNIKLLQKTLDGCRQARLRLAAQISDLTLGLTRLRDVVAGMRTVEAQMRMIGMNAVISCANLGTEGHALKEISVQLRELAGAISGRFDKIYISLKRMELAAGNATDQLADSAQKPFDRLEATASQMVEDLLLVQQVLTSLGDAFVAIGAVDTARQWEQARARLGEHARQLDQATETLHAVAEMTPSVPLSAAADRILQTFPALYTMSAERTCHANFLAVVGGEMIASVALTDTGPPAVDDIFF